MSSGGMLLSLSSMEGHLPLSPSSFDITSVPSVATTSRLLSPASFHRKCCERTPSWRTAEATAQCQLTTIIRQAIDPRRKPRPALLNSSLIHLLAAGAVSPSCQLCLFVSYQPVNTLADSSSVAIVIAIAIPSRLHTRDPSPLGSRSGSLPDRLLAASLRVTHTLAHPLCDNAKSLGLATFPQKRHRSFDPDKTFPRPPQRLVRITLPHPRPHRMQDDIPLIPRRDLLIPKGLSNGHGVFDTSDDEGIFTPGPEYSSAATSMGTMSKKPLYPLSRPTTPKAQIMNPSNTPSAHASPVAPLPAHVNGIDRDRERERKRKREQTPIDDAVQLQLQFEHKERDNRTLDRQATKSPSPASVNIIRPIMKKSPKKGSVRFSSDVRGPSLSASPIALGHKKKSSIDAATQNDNGVVRDSESDTLEEEKNIPFNGASPPRTKKRKTMNSRRLPSPNSTMATAGLLAAIGFMGFKFLAPESAEAKLKALCNLPGMHGITENLPFCTMGGSGTGRRGPFNYGKGDQAPPDYKRLMELQFSFEKILEDSVGGSRLAYDMKTSEMAVRDLTTLVRVSGLACRDQLSIHLEQFGDTARVASRSLSRFSSRVMGTIDSILALDEWAKKTLEDIRDSEAATKMSITSLVMWRDNDQIRKDVSNTFLKTTEGMDGQLQRLVMEAQGVLAILDQLEDRLNTIHEIVSREANHIKIENDEVLSAILTKLGANKQKIARNKEHVKLLNNVSHYRKTALSHVSATVVELERMSADLEQLRETVAAPSLLEGIVEVPIELHIRNIDQGIMRLTAGRIKASSRKEEYHQAVMAGIDYQNKIINAQIAEIASKPLVHNVDI